MRTHSSTTLALGSSNPFAEPLSDENGWQLGPAANSTAEAWLAASSLRMVFASNLKASAEGESCLQRLLTTCLKSASASQLIPVKEILRLSQAAKMPPMPSQTLTMNNLGSLLLMLEEPGKSRCADPEVDRGVMR
jgi:hypothetical protein